ncbi:helix-turn-helix transcriptional regulator [Desulfofundulus sp. TPOSR]|nr:helix-turn-helix transcriptional regulator [Desulfofundulus sp. TPOSR]
MDAALNEFQENLLNLIDPARRRTRAIVYAANHAREWAEEGARLQSLREQAGVSRTALAKTLGVSPQRIARLEQGMPVVDERLLRAAYLLFLENLTAGKC